jgi:hypothetical protein
MGWSMRLAPQCCHELAGLHSGAHGWCILPDTHAERLGVKPMTGACNMEGGATAQSCQKQKVACVVHVAEVEPGVSPALAAEVLLVKS